MIFSEQHVRWELGKVDGQSKRGKNRYYMSSPTETILVGVEIHPCKSEILVSFARLVAIFLLMFLHVALTNPTCRYGSGSSYY